MYEQSSDYGAREPTWSGIFIAAVVHSLSIAVLLLPTSASASDFTGTAAKIYDGDTLGVCSEIVCQKFRLCGIDAPERGKPGYAEARNALSALVIGKEVRCVQVDSGTPCDGKSRRTNRDRIVAQCMLDGRDVADELVAQGHACDVVKFSGGHYSRGDSRKICSDTRSGATLAGFFGWLSKWQTLVAGVLALAAGIITVAAIYCQTRSHEREARERRERLVRAYRASLSDDLAAIINYATESGRAIHEMLKLPSRPLDMAALKVPSLDPKVLDHLRLMIENHDPRSGEVLADLIGCYQVQHDRLAGEIDSYNPPSMKALEALDPGGRVSWRWNIVFLVPKTVELHVRASQLFGYARRETETIAPPVFDDQSVSAALLQSGLFDLLDEDEKKRVYDAAKRS